jgi:hypothetical protein
MGCGPKPKRNDFKSFQQNDYDAALESYNTELDAWEEAGGAELVEKLQGELAAELEAQQAAVAELEEFKEKNMVDGEFGVQASIDLMTEVVDMIDEATADIEVRAPDRISEEAQGVLGYTRGTTYALNSYAISNLLFTRNEIFVDGMAAVMGELTNSVMAMEQSKLDVRSAQAYADLGKQMDRQQQVNNMFQILGFGLGAGLGAFAGPGGAVAGAQTGAQIGGFLGGFF